jgi:TPP-dependent pyruvate/acetoin dehydrogenase alpha subunit
MNGMTINLPGSEQLALYRRMMLIRKAEERLAADFKAGKLPGPVHIYIGQEAVAVGISAHLRDSDVMTSTHRGHGHFLAKGGDLGAMFAEVYGRATGICGGMGGSMHVADFDRGILGANGIVGAGIPLACGAALAAQLDGKGAVAVGFFGDGASAQGVLSETLNIAALWDLPLILCCENNGFSEFSPSAAVNSGEIADRAKPFGVPAMTVDGNDLIAVWQTADEAIARARSGNGPTLIEARTYRFHGHVEGEKGFLKEIYRTDDEVEARRAGDPVAAFRARILAGGEVAADAIESAESEIAAQIEAAAAAAEAARWPDPSSLSRFVLKAQDAA